LFHGTSERKRTLAKCTATSGIQTLVQPGWQGLMQHSLNASGDSKTWEVHQIISDVDMGFSARLRTRKKRNWQTSLVDEEN